MNPLFEAAKEVCEFLKAQNWEFCIIGGLAVQQWGEPRTTLDTDITLLVPWGEEEGYVDNLLKHFRSRMSDARDFALTRRVLLLRASNNKDVDISLGALPFEVEMVSRAVNQEFAPGLKLPCCSAEDLFIMKVFAGRPRDLLDAENIVARQFGLDTAYIIDQLSSLCELREDSETIDRARLLLKSL